MLCVMPYDAGGVPGPPLIWIVACAPDAGGAPTAQGLSEFAFVGRVLPIRKDDHPVGFVRVNPPDHLPGPIGYGPVIRSTSLICAAVRHWSLSAPLHCRLFGSKPHALGSRTSPSGPAQCAATLCSNNASFCGEIQLSG